MARQMTGERSASGKPQGFLTIDVEDWYHILEVEGSPGSERWEALPSRVEAGFHKLLSILADARVKATCFFLGWIAEKYPQLVRDAVEAGHEIASHGYSHTLIYRQTESEFFEDVSRTKQLLESIAQTPVWGYRAAGFSMVKETQWAFDRLAAAGYRYDTSVFPGVRGHGGMRGAQLAPHYVPTPSGKLVEFPITLIPLLGFRVCFFGGGYLRLSPYALIKHMARRIHREGRPIVFYIHPREIDPHHPRLKMGLVRWFRSYVNLRSTEQKLRRLLADFRFTTLKNWMEEELNADERPPV